MSTRLSISPEEESVARPDSMVSLAASSSSSSWATSSSSRPTSYGSTIESAAAIGTKVPIIGQQEQHQHAHVHVQGKSSTALSSTTNHSSPLLHLPSAAQARRPGHALMRLRRVSMPAGELPNSSSEHPHRQSMVVVSTSRRDSLSPQLPPPTNRFSVASARSCDSLPEEESSDSHNQGDEVGAAGLDVKSSVVLQSAIPLPTRRVRLKSTRRQSSSPSGLRQEKEDGTTSRERSSGSRPVSLALPTTSPLIASSNKGEAFARESQTLRKSLESAAVLSQSQNDLKQSPGKGKPSVKFSTPPTRSIISAAAFNTAKRTARLAKKDRIANEILQTERAYVETLSEIQKHFVEPIARRISHATFEAPGKSHHESEAASHPILDQRSFKEVFSNFEDVRKLNIEILRLLEDSVASAPLPISNPAPPQVKASQLFLSPAMSPANRYGSIRLYQPPLLPIPRNIGATLAPILPFLKCYSLFVGNFARAQAVLEREDASNEAWKAFTSEKRRQGVGKGLTLTAMLLCIVQRVPRYKLLLGDLLRFTDPRDPDYAHLQKAVSSVEEVANHLESSIKEHENSMAMLNLQRCLIGLDVPLVIPGRKLIKSGILVKQGRRADEERAFFLFTDILVYADVAYSWSIPGLSNSMDGLSHGVSPSMSSEKSRLSIVWPSSGLPSGQGGVNPQYTFKHLFQLEDVTVTATDGQVFEVRTAIKSFSLVAATPDVKYEWVTAIREAKEELMRSRRSLLTEEEERRRSRLRRLSLPVPPPNMSRSSSRNGLLAETLPEEESSSPISQHFSTDMNGLFGSDGRPSRRGRSELSTSSSQRSSQSGDTKFRNIHVYEDYSAPIWVPNNRTDRCMRCQETFAIWRRRHHCRLCGDVVCWACSTKSFAIPSVDNQASHRIERACDECYRICFEDAEPGDDEETELESSIHKTHTGSESGYSVLGKFNPVRPLLARAVSLYEIATGISRSREGSEDSPSALRRSAPLGASRPRQQQLRESVTVLKTFVE